MLAASAPAQTAWLKKYDVLTDEIALDFDHRFSMAEHLVEEGLLSHDSLPDLQLIDSIFDEMTRDKSSDRWTIAALIDDAGSEPGPRAGSAGSRAGEGRWHATAGHLRHPLTHRGWGCHRRDASAGQRIDRRCLKQAGTHSDTSHCPSAPAVPFGAAVARRLRALNQNRCPRSPRTGRSGCGPARRTPPAKSVHNPRHPGSPFVVRDLRAGVRHRSHSTGCTFHASGRSPPQKTQTKWLSRTMLCSWQSGQRRNITSCVKPDG